jgi:hypothetical protein
MWANGPFLAKFRISGPRLNCFKMLIWVRIRNSKNMVVLKCSVVDPHHLDADPDSTYHSDANPDSEFFFADPDLIFHPDEDPDPDPSFKKRLKLLKKYKNRHTFWLDICKLMRIRIWIFI